MPTMAIGSSSAAPTTPASERDAVAASAGRSSDSTNRASAAGLGWSKTRVLGRAMPSSRASRLRRSTAVSESKPRSRKARSGLISVVSPRPRTAAAASRTRRTRWSARSAGDSAASWSRSRVRASSASGESSCPVVAEVRATASGRSLSSGRGRTAVNAGRKRSQWTSATATCVSPWSRACRSAATACSGSIVRMPRRASRSPSRPSASPPPPQAPQETDVAAAPRACRRTARASR